MQEHIALKMSPKYWNFSYKSN